ncbi:hypothetical protein AV530_010316 [Patagioenas fasciata monilis]|uniref:Mos1 transposase HTH domain-containing protein n=1 Tax=Patagioenas fasciata monilis TaxID=372326 RepID=A0A1V4KES1_PATFA|nr:hypothetical protein AV530_010316 [Patagioenas fasciata monilis]
MSESWKARGSDGNNLSLSERVKQVNKCLGLEDTDTDEETYSGQLVWLGENSVHLSHKICVPTVVNVIPLKTCGGKMITNLLTVPVLNRQLTTLLHRLQLSLCVFKHPTMEMMLDKKQIQAIFLLEFKMGHNTAETTRNIYNAFGPGTAKECTVQQWFKKFHKGHKSLENEERSGRSLEVDNDELRASIEADPLTTTQAVAKEFNMSSH